MNRDRGMQKWTAMMLPEHIQLLRDWQGEDTIDKSPEVDEWLLQEYADQVKRAWELSERVCIRYWQHTKRCVREGTIVELCPRSYSLSIQGVDGIRYKIDVKTIFEVSVTEWDVKQDDFF